MQQLTAPFIKDASNKFVALVKRGREAEAKRAIMPLIDSFAEMALACRVQYRVTVPLDLAKAKERALAEALNLARDPPELTSEIKSIRTQRVIPLAVASIVSVAAAASLITLSIIAKAMDGVMFAGTAIFGIAACILPVRMMVALAEISQIKVAIAIRNIAESFIFLAIAKEFGLTAGKLHEINNDGKPALPA